MNKLEEEIRSQNAAWWVANPEIERAASYNSKLAESYALTTVHWFHNAESSLRHDIKTGDGSGPMFPVDMRTCRSYAILATKAWLAETQTKLDAFPEALNYFRGDERVQLEIQIRNLQIALDDFAWNDSMLIWLTPKEPQ